MLFCCPKGLKPWLTSPPPPYQACLQRKPQLKFSRSLNPAYLTMALYVPVCTNLKSFFLSRTYMEINGTTLFIFGGFRKSSGCRGLPSRICYVITGGTAQQMPNVLLAAVVARGFFGKRFLQYSGSGFINLGPRKDTWCLSLRAWDHMGSCNSGVHQPQLLELRGQANRMRG